MFVICIVCILINSILFKLDREISYIEFVKMSMASCLVCILFYGLVQLPTRNDTYFQSGKLITVNHHPYFKERYTQVHVQSYPCGKNMCTRTYTTTEFAIHKEHWTAIDNLQQELEISRRDYYLIGGQFGGKEIQSHPNRMWYGGDCVRGDDSLYSFHNETNTYKYPTTLLEYWHNPLKNTSSLFNANQEIDIAYPERYDERNNNRLLTNELLSKDWDTLNTKVYEKTGANVILVKLSNIDDAMKLKQAWNRGKKNDIIICYTGKLNKPDNVYIFGWYKSEIVAQELQTYILDNGIKSSNLDSLIPIISKYYAPFDFSQFKYLQKTPTCWQLICCIFINILVIYFAYSVFRENSDRR